MTCNFEVLNNTLLDVIRNYEIFNKNESIDFKKTKNLVIELYKLCDNRPRKKRKRCVVPAKESGLQLLRKKTQDEYNEHYKQIDEIKYQRYITEPSNTATTLPKNQTCGINSQESKKCYICEKYISK